MRLENGSLEDLLHKFPRRSLAMIDKMRILAQIALIIGELHRVGVVHGDLKPANFLLGTATPHPLITTPPFMTTPTPNNDPFPNNYPPTLNKYPPSRPL